MSRVPFMTRDAMTPEGQEIWDEIETSRGGVARNYAALLNNAKAASSLAALGGYARFETPSIPGSRPWPSWRRRGKPAAITFGL